MAGTTDLGPIRFEAGRFAVEGLKRGMPGAVGYALTSVFGASVTPFRSCTDA